LQVLGEVPFLPLQSDQAKKDRTQQLELVLHQKSWKIDYHTAARMGAIPSAKIVPE
jgi:hypothetical protein